MARRTTSPIRNAAVAAALVLASIGLHAVLIGGLAGGFSGQAPVRPAPTVTVTLRAPPPSVAVAPPSEPATPAAATSTPPPARPRSPRPPAPKPAVKAESGSTSALAASPSGAVLASSATTPPRPETEAPPVTPESEKTEEGSGVDDAGSSPASAAAAGPAATDADPASSAAPTAFGTDASPETADPRTADPMSSAASPAATPPSATSPSDAPRPAEAHIGPPLPPLPASRRQKFRVYWGDYTEGRSVARLEYRLSHEADRYELRTDAEAEGLISLVYSGTLTQLSEGRLGPLGLEPTRYAELRPKRPERAVAFDPDARLLKPAGGAAPVPAPAGVQDRLSVFYQLGLLARADPQAFVAGAVRDMPIASMRDVRIERFEVVGDELLVVPGGPIRSLHLSRPAPEGTTDPRIDLWLGYDLDMLPVRLRIEDANRRVLDQVIERGG